MRLEDTKGRPEHVYLAVLNRAKRQRAGAAPPAEGTDAPSGKAASAPSSKAASAGGADVRCARSTTKSTGAQSPAAPPTQPSTAAPLQTGGENARDPAAEAPQLDPAPRAPRLDGAPIAASDDADRRAPGEHRDAIVPDRIVTGLAGWRKRRRREFTRRAAGTAAIALAVGFVLGWFLPSTLSPRDEVSAVARAGDAGPAAQLPDSALVPGVSANAAADAKGEHAATVHEQVIAAASQPPALPHSIAAPQAAMPQPDVAADSRHIAAAEPRTPTRQQVAPVPGPALGTFRATLEQGDVSDEAKLTLVEELARDRSKAATDELLAAAQSSSLVASMAAVRALIGRPCVRVEAPLIGLLDHSDWQRRAWAAKVLGKDGCKVARTPLRKRLGVEHDPRVRMQIAAAMRALGPRRR